MSHIQIHRHQDIVEATWDIGRVMPEDSEDFLILEDDEGEYNQIKSVSRKSFPQISIPRPVYSSTSRTKWNKWKAMMMTILKSQWMVHILTGLSGVWIVRIAR